MTVLLNNNFAGGPDGTTLTTGNTGQSSDNGFDSVDSAGTGTICQFVNVGANNLARPTAEFVLGMSTGSTATSPGVTWSTFGSIAQIWTRFYVYFTNPVSNVVDQCLLEVDTTGGPCCSLWLRVSGTPICFQLSDSTRGNTINMGSQAVQTGAWTRIEFFADMGATTSTLNYYSGANTDTTTITHSITQSPGNYGATGTCNSITLGQGANSQANTPTTYFSNWQVNNTGYPGPAPFRAGAGCPGILTNPIAIHSDIM